MDNGHVEFRVIAHAAIIQVRGTDSNPQIIYNSYLRMYIDRPVKHAGIGRRLLSISERLASLYRFLTRRSQPIGSQRTEQDLFTTDFPEILQRLIGRFAPD